MWHSLVNETLAKQKPGREENPQAGLTHPRPFSYLFYVASKPTGSNDHGITGLIRRTRLCVKPRVRLDRLRKNDAACLCTNRQWDSARPHDRGTRGGWRHSLALSVHAGPDPARE